MEKVKVNQKQADAIERLKEEQLEHLKEIKRDSTKFSNIPSWQQCLLDISAEDACEAMFVGYEVEPEFKVGDWVVPKTGGYLGVKHPQKITNIDTTTSNIKHFLEDGLWSFKSQLRHATPVEVETEKTRRWWKRHNRGVWELKVGDMVEDVDMNGFFVEVKALLAGGEYLLSDDTLVTKSDLNDDYLVVCFVNDRQDIKGDK